MTSNGELNDKLLAGKEAIRPIFDALLERYNDGLNLPKRVEDLNLLNLYHKPGSEAQADRESYFPCQDRPLWIICKLHYDPNRKSKVIRTTSNGRSWKGHQSEVQTHGNVSWKRCRYSLEKRKKSRSDLNGASCPKYKMVEYTPCVNKPGYALCRITVGHDSDNHMDFDPHLEKELRQLTERYPICKIKEVLLHIERGKRQKVVEEGHVKLELMRSQDEHGGHLGICDENIAHCAATAGSNSRTGISGGRFNDTAWYDGLDLPDIMPSEEFTDSLEDNQQEPFKGSAAAISNQMQTKETVEYGNCQGIDNGFGTASTGNILATYPGTVDHSLDQESLEAIKDCPIRSPEAGILDSLSFDPSAEQDTNEVYFNDLWNYN